MSTGVNLDGSSYNIPADGDNYLWAQGATGLSSYLIALVASFNNRGKISDIQDNLTSMGVSNKSLSANQGYVLNQGKINVTDIVNDLVTTATNKPLSANMGYTLQNTKSVRGGAVSSPSGNVTLSISDNPYQYMTPSVDINVTLPTTSIISGDQWYIGNLSTAFKITLKASGGTTICTIIPGSFASVISMIATPTLNTDWRQNVAMGGVNSWTPTFTNMAPTSVTAKCSRDGEFLEGEFKFVGGGGSAAEGRIGLPYGLLTATDYPTTTYNTSIVGDAAINLSGAEALYMLAQPNLGYLTFGLQNASNQGVVGMNGNVLDPYTTVGRFRVRISGWKLN